MEINTKFIDIFIHDCYNCDNKYRGGVFMDYKNLIIAMIKELDNTKDKKFLLQIFTMIKRHTQKG